MAANTKGQIMVVDDDRTLLDLITRMLSVLGFDVTPVDSGSKALAGFRQDDFRLVLTDLQMPGIDGWELARRLKKEQPWLPVIAITGQGREAVLAKLGASGIERVLFKPFTIEQLGQVVRSAMARPHPPAASDRLALLGKSKPGAASPGIKASRPTAAIVPR